MKSVNQKIFSLLFVAVSLLFINPCFAMSGETLSMYNQIVSKSNDLDKYIQDINDNAKQINKFKQKAEDIKKDYKNIEQTNINKSIDKFEKLKIQEQEYIDSLPLTQAKNELNNVITLVKEFLPKLQQEEFMIDEDHTDYAIANKLTVTGQTLQKAAKYNEEIYNLKLELMQQQQLQQLEVRDLTIAQISHLNNKIASKNAKIAGINAQLTQLEKDIKANEEQLAAARKKMQQVINDQKKLKKYWWAFGYNLYLAGENIDNEVNKKYKHALDCARQFATKSGNYEKERNDLYVELSNLNQEIQKAQNDINECNKSLDLYIKQINLNTQLKLQFSDVIVEVGQLINTLEYNSNSVKALLKITESINFK